MPELHGERKHLVLRRPLAGGWRCEVKIDLDTIEATARKAQERSPGPWRRVRNKDVITETDGRFDWIYDSAPKPDGFDDYDGGEWRGNTVLETDGGYYEPKGATAEFIARCSPDVALALVARIRELEKRCHIVESHPPDFAIEGEPLETQVFILKERLLDERHKTYQLECEVKELEEEVARWKRAHEEYEL